MNKKLYKEMTYIWNNRFHDIKKHAHFKLTKLKTFEKKSSYR